MADKRSPKVQYLVRTVCENLQTLREFCTDTVSDRILRTTCSTLIRSLLVQSELLQAWKALSLPEEPKIRATCLRSTIGNSPLSEIVFAQAGGAKHNNMKMYATVTRNVVRERPPLQNREKDFPITDYLASPALVFGGVGEVSRDLLIRYVANKLGGTHIDQDREPSPKNKKNKRRDAEMPLVKALDAHHEAIQLAGKDAVYFELLAIGQAILASDDIASFVARAQADGLFKSN